MAFRLCRRAGSLARTRRLGRILSTLSAFPLARSEPVSDAPIGPLFALACQKKAAKFRQLQVGTDSLQ